MSLDCGSPRTFNLLVIPHPLNKAAHGHPPPPSTPAQPRVCGRSQTSAPLCGRLNHVSPRLRSRILHENVKSSKGYPLHLFIWLPLLLQLQQRSRSNIEELFFPDESQQPDALSHFHKIRRLGQRAEPRTRQITLMKIREGREEAGGRGLTRDQFSIANERRRKVAGRTGWPPRPATHAQEPGRTRRTCLHLQA